jgi:hypothetical protein
MKGQTFLILTLILTTISCDQTVSIKTNIQPDTSSATHRIDFIDHRGVAFLTLDSVFNDCYFYSASDCTDYFDHCLKPKEFRRLERGFLWSNLGDKLHHLIISYSAFQNDTIYIDKSDTRQYKVFNEQPYVIMKDTLTYLTDKKSKVSFIKMTAIGKINVVLLTNQIPYSEVDKYFTNIMQKAIIRYNFKPLPTNSFQRLVKQTDSVNRQNNYR